MKKILFFLITHFIIGTTAFAQQTKVYTLNLKDGSFLLEKDGNTVIRPKKEGHTFVIKMESLKLDTLFIDTIIVSTSNNVGKELVIKDSIKKELVSVKVAKKIHEGEKGFEKKLQLVTGKYDINWGDATWKVSLLSSGLDAQKQREVKIGIDTGNMEKIEGKGKTSLGVKAIFALLFVAFVFFIYRQRGKLQKLLRNLNGEKPLFVVSDNETALDLAAFAKQNKKMVRYEDGRLSLKEGVQALTISLPQDLQVKGKLTFELEEPASAQVEIYFYNNDKPQHFKLNGKSTFERIFDDEQCFKKISITSKGKNKIHLKTLIVETSPSIVEPEKPEEPETPQQKPFMEPDQVEEAVKEKPLMSKEFQQELRDLFNRYDSYKNLNDNAILVQLQNDIESSIRCPQEKDNVAIEVKKGIKDNILRSIRKNNYVFSLFRRHNENKEDFWSILDALLSKDIKKPEAQKDQDIPLSQRLNEMNSDDKRSLETFVLRKYIIPLEITQLNTSTLDGFLKSLFEFFQNLKMEDKPKDLVKELVDAVNSRLDEGKRLKADDVVGQLVKRLELPTNFDEAEQKVWDLVAKKLGVDNVNAETLEGEINTLIQQKTQSKIEEELPGELEKNKAVVEQQDLNEIQDALSGTIDDVQSCKTIAHVMHKVKGQISGVRDRERNAIANIRHAYHEQVGKEIPENYGLKETIKQFRIDVPESVRKQEWEKVGDILNKLGLGESNNVNETTLPSAMNAYYESRLEKEVTSQLSGQLKADRKNLMAILEELNKALNITNEAETLCKEYQTDTITTLKNQLEAIIATEKTEKEKVEKKSEERAAVINSTVGTLREQLKTSVTELSKLISKAGYLIPCTNDDEESENVADRNQEAMIEQFENLKEALLGAFPNDEIVYTPAEAKAKIQNVLEEDLAKAFANKDLSQFSVIDKIARYYAYSRLPFMTKNAQEADASKSLRSYGVVFDRSRITAIYAQMNQLLADFGIQLIIPSLFAERLGEGHFNRSTNDGDLAILCPHPEYWKQTIANADKKDIIIDIAAIGYAKDGKLVKETDVIINNN